MISKNNVKEKNKRLAERKDRFGIRKLTVGAASVLLGATLWLGTNAGSAQASTTDQGQDSTTQETNQEKPVDESEGAVIAEEDNQTNNTQSSADAVQVKQGSAVDEVKPTPVDTQAVEKTTQDAATVSDKKTAGKAETAQVNQDSDAEKKPTVTSDKAKQLTQSLAKATDQDKNTTTDPAKDIHSLKINYHNDTKDFDFGKVDDSNVKTGDTKSITVGYQGYKLMNPEALDGLEFKTPGRGNANLVMPDHDIDLTLHYAQLAPIKVDFVDTKGNLLTTYSENPTGSSTKSPFSDQDHILDSRISAYAIDIPGYELVSDPKLEISVNKVLTPDDQSPQVLKFVYKQTQPNAQEGLPDGTSSNIAAGVAGIGEDYGPNWKKLPGGFTVDMVHETYGDDNYEKQVEDMRDRYTKQGFSFLGIENDHKDSDYKNRLEAFGNVHFLWHKPVTVNYVDEDGNKLADSETLSFNKNNPDQANNGVNPSENWYPEGEWKTEAKHFDNYVLKTTKGATSGKFTTFGYNVTYVYTNKATGQVSYIDDTTNTTLATDSLNGKFNQKIDYTTQDKIDNYEKEGYKEVSNNFADGKEIFSEDPKKNTFEVHLVHTYLPVNPENPGKPGEPINPDDPRDPKDQPKYPEGSDVVTKKITRTIHYEGADEYTPEDAPQTVDFTANGVIDKVTGEWKTPLTWSADQNFPEKNSPKIPGYHVVSVDKDAAGDNVASAKVSHTDKNYTVTVKYAKDQAPAPEKQKAVVIYQDVNDPEAVVELGRSNELTGEAGQEIDYSTKDEIAKYENKGYVLVSNGFDPDGASRIFDNKADNEQIFYVKFNHGKQPVNPKNPGKPGEPINPNDPDGPKYPSDSDKVTETYIRTINYTGAGNKTPKSVEQKVNFEGSGVLDKVTGEWITPLSWSEDQTLSAVPTKIINGYHIVGVSADSKDGINVDAKTISHQNGQSTVLVTYAPNGHIVPVYPDPKDPTKPGDKIPNVPNPQYPTDPENPKNVTPDEPVPTIPGYKPEVPTVTPKKPSEDIPVIYVPDKKTVTTTVHYIDQNEDNKVITTSGDLTGTEGDPIDYSSKTTLDNLTKKGYELVNNGYDPNGKAPSFDSKVPVYNIILKHGTTPVNPENPGQPGEPINPDDPDGPKWPEGTDKNSIDKTVTRTIKFVDNNGREMLQAVEQPSHFTGSGVIDKVTGEWITPMTWSEEQTVNGMPTPFVPSYHVTNIDKDNDGLTKINPATLTHNDKDYTVTVTYNPNGKIVPVDPSGKPIPKSPTPQYPTDPKDPSKVTPNEPVPDIPGYRPQVPTVTPTDPDKDTPVIYVPDKVEKQRAVIQYIDQDNNNAIMHQDVEKGDSNTVITGEDGKPYSTAALISHYEDQGYELVKDNFPTNEKFDDDADVDQTYTVIFKHGTTTYDPKKNPGKPGEPINPKNPDGHKITDQDVDYIKNVTETVHYVGAGKDTPKDNVQKATWTRTITVDKVTGRIISSTEWTPDKDSYNEVATPVVPGYHADQKNVPATKVTQDSIIKTVTYSPNGHIVPVDQGGNPIPDAPQPQFPTDPDDPTKVDTGKIPSVPGYKPVDGKPGDPVNPAKNPSNDVEIPYTKVVSDGRVVINYVDQDEDNKLLHSDSVVGKLGDKITYTTADEIKKLTDQGYEIVTDGFTNGKDHAEFTKENNNRIYEVILKHGIATVTPDNPGKPGEPINPNDPNGPKWPDTTGKDNLEKSGTQTIKYVGAGNNTPKEITEHTTFTRHLVIDKVTGEIISKDNDWTPAEHTFDVHKTPVVDGYVADVKEAGGFKSTPENPDKTYVVTYKEIGKIVPVDKDGNPIPGAETPAYKNDPTDPTKVLPNEPVPTIDGWKPVVSSVTPQDPTKDTPVVYTKGETPVVPDSPSVPTPDQPQPEQPATPEPIMPKGEEMPGEPEEEPEDEPETTPVHGQDEPKTIKPKATVMPHGQKGVANKTVAPKNQAVNETVSASALVSSKALPQTGDSDNTAAIVAGAAAASIGLIGLAGVKKRREN